MNYFGHAALSTLAAGSPAFGLGSMLPDFCAMTQLRVSGWQNEDIARGAEFHLRTDALFHRTKTFTELNLRALRNLTELGVRRGPARAAAHIGIEMWIDSHLIEAKELLDGYLSALAVAEEAHHFRPLSFPERKVLQGLCLHLKRHGAQVHSATEARFFERLGHTLKGRRRLEPTRHELKLISRSLATAHYVRECMNPLMDELRPLMSCQRSASWCLIRP